MPGSDQNLTPDRGYRSSLAPAPAILFAWSGEGLVCPPQGSGVPSPGRSGVPSPGESLVCLAWRGGPSPGGEGSGVPFPPNVILIVKCCHYCYSFHQGSGPCKC